MVEFVIDNIYVEFGGHVYQQAVGIPMGTNCAPLVTDLFLYWYEANFGQSSRSQKNNLISPFAIDDVLSLTNPKFNDYIDVIYPKEFEIIDTTDVPKCF